MWRSTARILESIKPNLNAFGELVPGFVRKLTRTTAHSVNIHRSNRAKNGNLKRSEAKFLKYKNVCLKDCIMEKIFDLEIWFPILTRQQEEAGIPMCKIREFGAIL